MAAGATASIVIPSRDRCGELEATLMRLRRLDPAPAEIIVVLDGCTDGSRAMLAAFPEVTVVETAAPQGSIPARDTAFRMVRADFIVSLDDDSIPADDDFLAQLFRLAERHPEAGAFAFRELRPDGVPPAPRLPRGYVGAYPNCAGAIRRSLYGTATAYPRFFGHAYAEPDFCLQAYGAGHAVLHEPDIVVFHRFTDVQRDIRDRHHKQARNEFWSVLMRCPLPHALWVAPLRVLRQLMFAQRMGWGRGEWRWWRAALAGIAAPLAARAPVAWPIYWRWMRLARRPLASRAALLAAFPNIAARLGEAEPLSRRAARAAARVTLPADGAPL